MLYRQISVINLHVMCIFSVRARKKAINQYNLGIQQTQCMHFRNVLFFHSLKAQLTLILHNNEKLCTTKGFTSKYIVVEAPCAISSH